LSEKRVHQIGNKTKPPGVETEKHKQSKQTITDSNNQSI